MTNLKLNPKHLRYSWSVASHGTIARAAETLHLTPQTISGQLRNLEEQVGAKLFFREGRNLVLTATGRLVFTEEITERFYVISAERRIKHPAMSVITEAARSELFA